MGEKKGGGGCCLIILILIGYGIYHSQDEGNCRPSDGSYVSDSNDCETRSCSPPSLGFYTTTFCSSGGIGSDGHDTGTTSCSEPASDSFAVSPCISGSYNSYGSDTVTARCTAAPGQHYVYQACDRGGATKAGSDSIIKICSTPSTIDDGYYVASLCNAGTIDEAGSDIVIKKCSEPSGDNYVTGICTKGNYLLVGKDTAMSQCSYPTVGSFVSSGCLAGSSIKVGSNTAIMPCTAPPAAVPPNKWIANACLPGTPLEKGKDFTLNDCNTAVPPGSFLQGLCSPGSLSPGVMPGHDSVFGGCSSPSDGYFVTKRCIPSANPIGFDTVVKSFTAAAPGETFVAALGLPGSSAAEGQDVVFGNCTSPNSHEYRVHPCVGGSYKSPGRDAEVAQCSAPYIYCDSGTPLTSGFDYSRIILYCSIGGALVLSLSLLRLYCCKSKNNKAAHAVALSREDQGYYEVIDEERPQSPSAPPLAFAPPLPPLGGSNECIVCFDSPRNAMIVPCNHFALCLTCANLVKKCPICQGPKGKVVQIYSS